MQEPKTYNLEVTESELIIIHNTFKQLTEENFYKWMEFIKEGKKGTPECFQQWLSAGDCNGVRSKAAKLLGIEDEDDEEEDSQ